MDSQVTLVDIPELRRATASTLPFASKILHFTDNDIHNTKITIAGQPSTHYVVHSDGQATATRVTRITDGCDPVKVGGIQRRSLLPDLLTVGDFEMKLGQWLKMPLLYSIPATMQVHDATYTWRFLGWNQLGLYDDRQQVTTPVAWFDRSRVRPGWADGGSLIPTISICQEAEDMMDEIVLAVVIIEHRLRSTEAPYTQAAVAVSSEQPASGSSSQAKDA